MTISHPHPADEHGLYIGREVLPSPGHLQPFVQASVVGSGSSSVVGQPVLRQGTLSLQHKAVATALLSHSLIYTKSKVNLNKKLGITNSFEC